MSTPILNEALRADWAIYRGGPLPIVLDITAADGSQYNFPPGTQLNVKPRNGAAAFSLGVGTGITLSALNGAATGLFTALLTPLQSLAVVKGPFTDYEIIADGVIMWGHLVGEGLQ